MEGKPEDEFYKVCRKVVQDLTPVAGDTYSTLKYNWVDNWGKGFIELEKKLREAAQAENANEFMKQMHQGIVSRLDSIYKPATYNINLQGIFLPYLEDADQIYKGKRKQRLNMIKSYAAAAYLVCTDFNIKLSEDNTPLFDSIMTAVKEWDQKEYQEVMDYFNKQLGGNSLKGTVSLFSSSINSENPGGSSSSA